MKVIVASTGKDISSQVHDTFGRCPYFLVVELEGKKIMGWKAIENTAVIKTGGAGITAAQLVAEQGADAIIAQRIGPKAIDVLNQFKINVYLADGSIESAVKALANGKLKVFNGVPCNGANGPCREHKG